MSESSSSNLSRRRFLERSLVYGAVATAPTASAKPVSPSAPKRSGDPRFSLWCAPGGLISPTQPADEPAVFEFVEKCARHGVTHLVPTRGSRTLAQAAGEKGIVMHPYMAFNSHGARRMRANWSLNYIGLPYGSPRLKEKLDRHRPIWNSPRAVLSIGAFAKEHPDWWALDREGDRGLKLGSRLSMSLAVPEVRSYMVDRYLNMVEESGGHGVQVEFVSELRDRHGAANHGYESPDGGGVPEAVAVRARPGSRTMTRNGCVSGPDSSPRRFGNCAAAMKALHPEAPGHHSRHRAGSGGASRRPIPERLPGSPRLARRVVDGRTVPLVSHDVGPEASGTLHQPAWRN